MKLQSHFVSFIAGGILFGVIGLFVSQTQKVGTTEKARELPNTRVIGQLQRLGFKAQSIPSAIDEKVLAASAELEQCVHFEGVLKVTESSSCGTRSKTITINEVRYAVKTLDDLGKGDWLFRYDSHGQETLVLKRHVIDLYPLGDWLYVFTGGFGYDNGAVYKVNSVDLSGRPQLVSLLPDQPRFVFYRNEAQYSGGYFLIVTKDGLVRLTDGENYQALDILLDNQFWGGVSPSSAVIVDSQLVMGMRSGIVWMMLDGSINIDQRLYFYLVQER